ncbi:MAG: hypothetical protein AAF363_21070 [Bacteroidota bacterium]
MKNCIKAFLFIFLINCTEAFSQLDNTELEFTLPVTPQDSNTLKFTINTLGYLRNNEFSNDIADGFTLFGYQFQPTLSYFFGKYFRIDAGVYLLNDFGESDFSDIEPLLTIHYHKNNFEILFGALEGSYNHRLIEPLYGFERGINDRFENGVQFRYITDKLFSDVWVDWENAIFPGDTAQEEIIGGASLDYRWIDNSNWSFSTPVQLLIRHLGGQIDLSDEPTLTQVNLATGLNLERKFNSRIKRAGLSAYFVGFQDNSGTVRNFEDGAGLYINGTLSTKRLDVIASYWQSEEFQSFRGGDLYQSVSRTVKTPDVIERNRGLLFLRFLYHLPLADYAQVGIRFEPHYDLENESMEFSHGFYLKLNTEFTLVKFNKNK